MKDRHVWIIDDDRSMRWVLERALGKAGIPVKVFESAARAMREMQQHVPAAILTDVRMPGLDGFEFLEQVQMQHPKLPVIVMTAYSDLQSAVVAYEKGAFEYLPKPFDMDEAVELVRRACQDAGEDSASPSAGNGPARGPAASDHWQVASDAGGFSCHWTLVSFQHDSADQRGIRDRERAGRTGPA